LARSLGLRSAITVPMMIHGRTIGAITFIWAESEQRYDRADLETATLIGQRAALAIENSKLHRDVQKAVRARDDLLAVVSHDLRNPLEAISLKAEAIVRFLPDEPAAAKPRKYAEGIQAAVRRMDHLIKDLLDLGSIEGGHLKLEPTFEHLEAIISSAVEEIQPLALAKGLRVEAERPAPPVRLLCDKSRILQVLSNLLGNAVKFTPSGGSILVRPSLEAGSVKVLVSDTGRGVAAEHLARIFDRYYQEPEHQRGGVGLGLFIASGIVSAHGGEIWAESTPGVGSKFYFTLPVDPGQSP
jgi:signal transduction histidine kinase